jgi:hypothetical protein
MPGNPTENTPRGVLKPPKDPRGAPIGGDGATKLPHRLTTKSSGKQAV